MSSVNSVKTCLICLKHNTKLMCFDENMPGFVDITIYDLLKNLNFLNISGGVCLPKMLCFICVAKIQYCYEFKLLCRESENMLKTLAENRIVPTNETSNHLIISNIETLENNAQSNQKSNPLCNSNEFVNADKSNDYEVYNNEISPNYENNIFLKTEIEECTQNDSLDNEENYAVGNNDAGDSSHFQNTIPDEYYEANEQSNSNNGHMQIVDDSSLDTSEEKLYVCNICNKSFNYKSNLNTHKILHHSNKKNFVCTVCEKSFKLKAYLKTHMIRHTGERPYPCDICSKRFTQSSSLRSHKAIHERNFNCSVCQKSFKRKSQLVVHGRTHTANFNLLLKSS